MVMISVQPTGDERDALRRLVLQFATAMGSQLAGMAAQIPPAPGYLELRARQQALLNDALVLETRQLQLIGSDALGAAVDAINGATRALQDALVRQQAVARDIGIATAAVGFVAAVLAGKPQDIIAAARMVQGSLAGPAGMAARHDS